MATNNPENTPGETIDLPNAASPMIGPDAPAQADLTGRDRLARNVIFSWAGHFVFIVAGFIMPRFMDRRLGQEALGVWDFGWALVGYFGLVQLGIGASINRYVARHRALRDTQGVNCSVSSVTCVLVAMAFVMLALTAGAAFCVSSLLSAKLGAFVGDALWMVVLLGAGMSMQTALAGFGGVITGCHRWDLHNAILSGGHAVTVAGMIALLLLGGGLVGLAGIVLAGDVLTAVVRYIVAYRVCPGLSVRLAHARWTCVGDMLHYGAKSFIPSIGYLLLNQTTSLVITAYLGPAALALYSRPRSLVGHASVLMNKFAFVLTPTASSLHATAQKEELRRFLVQSTRYGACIALPLVLTLAILGGPIMLLWMGPRYEQGLLLAVLAIGSIVPMVSQPALNVLAGMNAHGRPGIVQFVAACVTPALAVLAVGPLHWGLVGAGIAVTVPTAVMMGIYVPLCASRRLRLPIMRFLIESLRVPVLCCLPFAMTLAVAGMLFPQDPLLSLACGGIGGTIILSGLYWLYVLPAHAKNQLVNRLLRRNRLASCSSVLAVHPTEPIRADKIS